MKAVDTQGRPALRLVPLPRPRAPVRLRKTIADEDGVWIIPGDGVKRERDESPRDVRPS